MEILHNISPAFHRLLQHLLYEKAPRISYVLHVIEHLEGDMTYKRMTEADRRHIHRWRQEGDGAARDCSALGVCDEQHQPGAFPQHRRPGPRRFTDEDRAAVELRLKKGWTPELISGRARLEGHAMVCKESIYQHIYCDAKAGGDLWAPTKSPPIDT